MLPPPVSRQVSAQRRRNEQSGKSASRNCMLTWRKLGSENEPGRHTLLREGLATSSKRPLRACGALNSGAGPRHAWEAKKESYVHRGVISYKLVGMSHY